MTEIGVNYTEYRERYQPLFKYPFSSARKRMSVVVEMKDRNYIFVKGASEMILKCCTKWYDPSTNRVEVMSSTAKDKIEDAINKMAEESLRTLCLAYREVGQN